jgi:hypothetical protein
MEKIFQLALEGHAMEIKVNDIIITCDMRTILRTSKSYKLS